MKKSELKAKGGLPARPPGPPTLGTQQPWLTVPLSRALWGKVAFFSAFLLFDEALSSLSCFSLFSPLIHTPVSRRQDTPPWTQGCKCDHWAYSTTQLGRQGCSHIWLGALGLNRGVPSRVRGSGRQACHLSPRGQPLGFNGGALPGKGRKPCAQLSVSVGWLSLLHPGTLPSSKETQSAHCGPLVALLPSVFSLIWFKSPHCHLLCDLGSFLCISETWFPYM